MASAARQVSNRRSQQRRNPTKQYKSVTHLVPHDLSLGVILEVAVPLEPVLHERAKLLREGAVLEQVVHAQTRARRLGRVRRADALLGRADARPAKLDFFQAVDDLVEVEDEVGAVGDEQTSSTVKSCGE